MVRVWMQDIEPYAFEPTLLWLLSPCYLAQKSTMVLLSDTITWYFCH